MSKNISKLISSRFPYKSHLSLLFTNNSNSIRPLASSISHFSTIKPPSDMMEERFGRKEYNPLYTPTPRPTQYQPIVVNSVINPEGGKEIHVMRYIWVISVGLAIFACIQSIVETNNYYNEHGHRYESGWDVFHYHHKKGTYYE